MSLVVCHSQSGCHIISHVPGRLLRQPCPAAVKARQLHNARTQHAAVAFLPTGKHLGQHPAFQVGAGAHGRPLTGASHAIRHQSTVSGRINIRQIRAELSVHQNRSPLHFNAAVRQPCRIGTDADGKHHQISRKCAGAGLHRCHPAVAQQLFHHHPGDHADSVFLQMTFRIEGHFRIQHARHDLRRGIQHRHLQPLGLQVLGCLQPDKSAAHNHGLFRLGLLHICSHVNSVIRHPEFEYAF